MKNFARKISSEQIYRTNGFVFAFVALSSLLFSLNAHAFGPPSVQYNDEGIDQYKSEDYNGAFDNFAKALGRDPFNSSFHLNLGDAFYKGKELDKAMAEFESVEASPKSNPDQKFKAMFNAGNVAVEAKNIPKALQYYQKALEYDPNSLEVKTNIELALKDQQGGGKGDDKDQKDQNQQNQQDKKDQKDQKNQNQKDQKDQKDQQKDQNQNDKQQQKDQKDTDRSNKPEPKPTPHGFESQALNEGDVRRILEELKRQEEEIRAKQYKERRDSPEREIEKDW